VTDTDSYLCDRCGERHEGLPFSYGVDAPVHWSDEYATRDDSVLDQEICIVRNEHFFVKGIVYLPVRDADQDFEWTVWVSLSRANMTRALDLWTTEGRESEPAYFGWLSTELSAVYGQTTVNLKTHVHTRPVGTRPLIFVEPDDHPLYAEQQQGITRARVREIAEIVLHG